MKKNIMVLPFGARGYRRQPQVISIFTAIDVFPSAADSPHLEPGAAAQYPPLELIPPPPKISDSASQAMRISCVRCSLSGVGQPAAFGKAGWHLVGSEWAICAECAEVIGWLVYVRKFLVRFKAGKVFIIVFVGWNIVEFLLNVYQLSKIFFLAR